MSGGSSPLTISNRADEVVATSGSRGSVLAADNLQIGAWAALAAPWRAGLSSLQEPRRRLPPRPRHAARLGDEWVLEQYLPLDVGDADLAGRPAVATPVQQPSLSSLEKSGVGGLASFCPPGPDGC